MAKGGSLHEGYPTNTTIPKKSHDQKWTLKWLRIKYKFNISDEAYHEIRMMAPDASPPLYKIKEERMEQNKTIDIKTDLVRTFLQRVRTAGGLPDLPQGRRRNADQQAGGDRLSDTSSEEDDTKARTTFWRTSQGTPRAPATTSSSISTIAHRQKVRNLCFILDSVSQPESDHEEAMLAYIKWYGAGRRDEETKLRKVSLNDGRKGMEFPSRKYLTAKEWFHNYMKKFGDSMPNSQNVHLPQCVRKSDVFHFYQEDLLYEGTLKRTRFMKMWKKEFPHVKIPPVFVARPELTKATTSKKQQTTYACDIQQTHSKLDQPPLSQRHSPRSLGFQEAGQL
ncbi:ATP binding [Branchiostoma belcheri]|nr:ATP binding [Branchiostoma belcheri]